LERRDTPSIDHKSTLATLALVAAVLSLVFLAASLQPPPPSSAELFTFAARHRTAFGWFASLVLAWSVLSIPLVVTSGTLLQPPGGTLAGIAQLLSAVGVLMLGFAVFAHTAALLSIVSAGGPARAEDAAYQAAFLSNLRFYLTDPGLMTWGLGQFLFGRIAWRSGILPNWVAVVGMVGGIAGLLTLAVYQTGVLALVQLASFTVWGFATALLLFRNRKPRAQA
jgi:hypothetical protein